MPKVKQNGTRRKPNGGRGRKRVPGLTRLSAKNQITIPVDALRTANLMPGEELRVVADGDGKLMVERASKTDPVAQFIGCLPSGTRDEWRASRELSKQRDRRLGLREDDGR